MDNDYVSKDINFSYYDINLILQLFNNDDTFISKNW